MNNLKVIVTGTGRCGTVGLAKFLTSVGVPCTHEGIFDYSSRDIILERIDDPQKRVLSECSQRSSFYASAEIQENWINPEEAIVESSYLAAPYLNYDKIKSIPVIHLVRHPIKVISSFLNDFNYFKDIEDNLFDQHGYELIIQETLPKISTMESPIEKACFYYYYWNKLIEKSCQNRPYLRMNIEQLDKEKICHFLNIDKSLIKDSFDDKRANTNKKSPDIKIEEIPRGEIKDLLFEMIEGYGYKKPYPSIVKIL